jgi:Adenylate and Guanylate cyclase catalytic domain
VTFPKTGPDESGVAFRTKDDIEIADYGFRVSFRVRFLSPLSEPMPGFEPCRRLDGASSPRCVFAGSSRRLEVMAEARKTVTVVFTDVTGSTSLGERLDPEALRRVMEQYFDATRSVLERHGGMVEKFIGDAVMAVFGIPTTHEDDALRAVKAAAEMRERLVVLNTEIARERGVRLTVRTGINTGEAVVGDPESPWGAKTQSERQNRSFAGDDRVLAPLRGRCGGSALPPTGASASLPTTSRETPHSKRCAITLSMMPYSFASSAVMK